LPGKEVFPYSSASLQCIAWKRAEEAFRFERA
jgi:hypothetical protein